MKKVLSIVLILCLIFTLWNIPSVGAAGVVHNVKSYGAVGDGITDDSPAVNAALGAAAAGDTIYFPNGTYNLTQVIKLKDGMKVLGESKTETVLSWSYLDVSKNFIYGGASVDNPSNPRNMELANFTVDGNNILSERSGALLFEHTGGINIHDLVIQNVQISETGQNAIHFKQNVDDSFIRNCSFYNIGVGAKRGETLKDIVYTSDPWGAAMRIAWGSERVTVEGNYIENTSRGGILCNNGASGLIIRGNTIKGSAINTLNKNGGRGYMGLGIELWSGCDNSLVEDNTVDQWISIVRCDNMSIRRNRVEETTLMPGTNVEYYKSYGFELNISNSVITDNYSGKGHTLGMSLLGSGVGDSDSTSMCYSYFGNNTFKDSMQWGAQFYGQNNMGIDHNYFYRTDFLDTRSNLSDEYVSYANLAGTAIRIDGNTSHMTFEECKFNGGREGIGFCGRPGLDYFYFTDCEIKDNWRMEGYPSGMYSGETISSYWDSTNQKGFTAFETNNMIVSGNERTNSLPANIPFDNALPTASFIVSGSANTLTFTNQSTDTDGTIANYLWDFGEGLPSTEQNPTHTYGKDGIYTVTLIVWDSSGRADRYAEVVTIGEVVPTEVPTVAPTQDPSATAAPTAVPTAVPTAAPTAVPTAVPTPVPTPVPTAAPTPDVTNPYQFVETDTSVLGGNFDSNVGFQDMEERTVGSSLGSYAEATFVSDPEWDKNTVFSVNKTAGNTVSVPLPFSHSEEWNVPSWTEDSYRKGGTGACYEMKFKVDGWNTSWTLLSSDQYHCFTLTEDGVYATSANTLYPYAFEENTWYRLVFMMTGWNSYNLYIDAPGEGNDLLLSGLSGINNENRIHQSNVTNFKILSEGEGAGTLYLDEVCIYKNSTDATVSSFITRENPSPIEENPLYGASGYIIDTFAFFDGEEEIDRLSGQSEVTAKLTVTSVTEEVKGMFYIAHFRDGKLFAFIPLPVSAGIGETDVLSQPVSIAVGDTLSIFLWKSGMIPLAEHVYIE